LIEQDDPDRNDHGRCPVGEPFWGRFNQNLFSNYTATQLSNAAFTTKTIKNNPVLLLG